VTAWSMCERIRILAGKSRRFAPDPPRVFTAVRRRSESLEFDHVRTYARARARLPSVSS
jgi:hypothetical protein